MSNLPRPEPTEHAAYYGRYIALVPGGDILVTLRDQLEDTLAVLSRVTPDRETFRYAEGKWSVREVVGHVLDTERVFAFRALAMARSESAELPGMEQDEWAARSNAHERTLQDLTDEWVALRRANVHMFGSFTPEMGSHWGVASGFGFTVRSFAWLTAGHELWHRVGLERDYLKLGASGRA